MTSTLDYRFRVSLHDTDAAGMLFFAHLFRHAHDAYESWMSALGHPLHVFIDQGDLGLPLVHAEADYRRPLRHGDLVRVGLSVSDLRATRFAIRYQFERIPDALAATALTVHVCIDQHSGRPLPLPDDLVAALGSALRRNGSTSASSCSRRDRVSARSTEPSGRTDAPYDP